MPRELKPCGSVAAFRRHKRHDEDVCDRCQDAMDAYQREYQATYRRTHPRRRKAATR